VIDCSEIILGDKKYAPK